MGAQSYKIYFYENSLIVASGPEHFSGVPNVYYIGEDELERTLKILESSMSMGRTLNYALLTEDPDHFLNRMYKEYKLLEAAGGLVLNPEGKLLAILRHGRWDLPKGKIESNEKRREAAEREVEEECGLQGLVALEKAGITYHTYMQENERILKVTHWFHMRCDGTESTTPQAEEGITEIRWVDPKFFNDPEQASYNSIRDLVKTVFP